MKNKENKMKFKTSENEVTLICGLANRLVNQDWRCWFSIDENDISNCEWWIAPIGTSPIDARKRRGGVGVLLRELRTACYDSGALQHHPRVSTRNHVRLSCDANGKRWTTDNGG